MKELAAPSEKSLDAGQSMRRFLLEAGPLGAFFVGYVVWNLFVATGVLMVAVVVALALSYYWERRIPFMPLVTAAMVLVFGGLTLYLKDETFIKMKPTIVNSLFAAALFIGLAFGRGLLKPLFGPAFQLDDAGWRKLSFRWGCFFVFLALLNEYIWRSYSEAFWVNFKVWGMFPLTLLFAVSQVPLIQKHSIVSSSATPTG
jgi:intracellular septation protein